MKKMLVMAKSLGGGGTEVALIEFLNRIDFNKYEVTLVLLDDDNEYKYRLKKSVNIKKICFKSSIYHSLVSMDCFIGKVIKKIGVNKYIKLYDWLFKKVCTEFNKEYDIAIDFYGYGGFLTAFMTQIKAKKKVTWLHDEKMPWFKNVVRYTKQYDRIFAVSQAVKQGCIKQYPFLADKCEVFYNVIDCEEILKRSKEEMEFSFGESFNILTVGRLTEQKGYDIAIKAAKILKEKSINFTWYIIGNGRDEKRLKRTVKTLGLENEVIFLGRKDNPYPYMANCDLYVQPSRHEGYGLTVVEARALNVPIIASDLEAFKEQIEDGVNGYIVPLHAEEIAEKIALLYKNPEMISTVVENLKDNRIDFSKEMEKLEYL